MDSNKTSVVDGVRKWENSSGHKQLLPLMDYGSERDSTVSN